MMLLACVSGKAQMFFSPMASSSNAFTATSSPFIVEGQGKCLVSGSGLSALRFATTNASGSFGAGCVETPPVATVPEFSVSLNLFPNPTKGMTTIKAAGQFDASLSCQIRIMSVDGKVVLNRMVPMNELKTGFVFDASGFATGTYVAVIEFMNQRFPVKFIKA